MDGLGERILLEGRREGREEGIDLSVEVFKAVQAGNWNNTIIAEQCGCTVEKVAEIREKFGI